MSNRKKIKSIYERLSNNSMEELKTVWREAWNTTTSADNCYDSETPTRYADIAVIDYFERFIESQLLRDEEKNRFNLESRKQALAQQGIKSVDLYGGK